MVRIDVVVTRGGDAGETSLGDGARLRKDAPRIEAIGAVDETNAAVGMLRLATQAVLDVDAMLARIQNDLFDVGADLAVPGEGGDRLRMTDAASVRLESEVEAMNADLPALTSFVLPGGSPGASGAPMRPRRGAKNHKSSASPVAPQNRTDPGESAYEALAVGDAGSSRSLR